MQPLLEHYLSNVKKHLTIIAGGNPAKGRSLDHVQENIQSVVSYTLSATGSIYSIAAQDVSDWAQALGFVVMLLVGLVRLAYDLTRYFRYLKSKRT